MGNCVSRTITAMLALVALATGPAAAQGKAQCPPGVVARGAASGAACRAVGETPIDGPQAGAKPQVMPSPAATAAGSMTLTEADKAAAFRLMGFKRVGRVWKRCDEDPPTASYTPGAIEEVLDLNGDGRPEAVITEGSLFCYGQQGSWFAIVSKEPDGSWRQVLEIDGVFSPLDTRVNGWHEVMAAGPGFTHPVYRYDGKEYVRNRMQRE